MGYTGDAVDLQDYGFDAPVVYDLATLKIANQQMPLNYNHRTKVGMTDRVENTKQVVRGTGAITEQNKAAQRISNADFNMEASMGLDVESAQVTYSATGFEANSQTFTGPHYLIKNAIVDEMTITESGRDVMTKVHKLSRMELSKIKTPAPKTKKVANRQPINVNINNQLPTPLQRREGRKKEVVRHVLSYSDLRRLENEYPEQQELILKGVDDGWSFNRIKNAVKLAALEDQLPVPPRLGGDGSNDDLEVRLVSTLCKDPEKTIAKYYGEETRDRILNSNDSFIGLKELLVVGANRLGGNFTGYSDIENMIDFIGRANSGRLNNSSSFSSFSMPNLFKRATEIVMEESWKVQDYFAQNNCFATSHNDFKKTTRIRPAGGTMWEGLDANGRVKHGSFGKESTYTAELDTKAQMLGFNREMIENDDMGVIDEIMTLMTEGALIVPDYKLLQHMLASAGNGFWSTSDTATLKKNLYTGTALTPANLSTVYLAAQKQVIDKGRVNWVNQITDEWDLVIPPELEETAWNIIKQDKKISPSDTSTFVGEKNYWFGKFGIKKFNQLSNTSMHSSANATRWFLWPKNTRYAPFAVSYLRNRRRPIVQVKEAPVDMLGFVVVGVFDININDREQSAIIRCEA